MNNFILHNPVKLLFGQGQIALVGREIPVGSKVLFAYGGGSIKHNGVYAQIVESLTKAGLKFVEFAGIEANPQYETLMRAVRLCREQSVDFILAVGGGSVIDGCKFIAAAVDFDGDAWTIAQSRAKIRSALPLGTVLTLPATGSEMNSFSVVSRQETGEKRGFGHPRLMPRFSVLDPETTYSLPHRQLGNGIVDAYIHVLEQYLTYPSQSPLQDRLAESILSTLIEIAPAVLADPPDYQARANLMWCATMALNGLIGMGVPQDWTTHMIGHELTAITGLDHARTLAAVWPGVVQVMQSEKQEKLRQYARRVWGVDDAVDDDAAIQQAIALTRSFFHSVGVPSGMGGYDLPADIADQVALRLEQQSMLPLGERSSVTADKVRDILHVQ